MHDVSEKIKRQIKKQKRDQHDVVMMGPLQFKPYMVVLTLGCNW